MIDLSFYLINYLSRSLMTLTKACDLHRSDQVQCYCDLIRNNTHFN